MKIPIKIKYSILEDQCYFDKWENGVICDDLKTIIETTPETVELNDNDIKTIIEKHLNKVLETLLNDEKYRELLKKKILEITNQ